MCNLTSRWSRRLRAARSGAAQRRVRLHVKPTRHLARRDFSAVLAINAMGFPGVAPLDEVEIERLMLLPNAHLAVSAVDDYLLGYALAFPDHAPYDGEEFQVLLAHCPRPFLYIDQVAIAPNMRRKGVASALYSALEVEARKLSMSRLCCEVNLQPPNPVSVAFHQTMGFEQLEKLETADGRTVILLGKSIK